MSKVQDIYNTLRSGGLTEAAALGMLGNWQCESGLEPNRVQGDFSPYRTASKDYTARVESGAITRDQFARDSKGYGLAQWTYFTRKENLWDFWKKSGTALDDAVMQTKFALSELINDYPSLMSRLRTETDLYTCTKLICEQYERPAINNIDARFSAAKAIKAQLATSEDNLQQNLQQVANQVASWEKIPATDFWPPRTICKGMNGADVEVLQAILKARGWIVTNPDGIFGSYLEERVKEFQDAYHLDVDGIVGKKTWAKLLETG